MARPILPRTSTLLALLGFAAVVVPLALVGCKSKKEKRPADEGFEETDLAWVCAGIPESRAKPYSKDSPNAHGIVQFTRASEQAAGESEKVYPQLLGDFLPGKPEDVELVTCIVRTGQTKTETCEYENDHHLEVHEATFEITIREATTAAVVQTRTVSLAAPPCWGFTRFAEKTEKAYPDPQFAAAELARELVLPREGGAAVPLSAYSTDIFSDTSFKRVCHGIPERRAPAYQKVAGTVSPANVLWRGSDRHPYETKPAREFEPWQAKDFKDTQLVVCITEKTRTKLQTCTFDAKPPAGTVDYFDASYEVTVREARTARIVATQTIAEQGEKACPTSYLFFKTIHAEELPFAGPGTVAFLRPLLAP